MSTVIPFQHPKTLKTRQPSMGADLFRDFRPSDVTPIKRFAIPPNPTLPPAEALENSLDKFRATRLSLAHRRQEFELEMALEENVAILKLEAAGYKALLAGVPESDIYALGEDMAEALESAMNTVAGA